MKTTLFIITLLLLITGCNNEKNETKVIVKKEESFHTVKYYLDHKELRKIRLKECRNLTKITNTEAKDCDNAKKAARKARQNKTVDF